MQTLAKQNDAHVLVACHAWYGDVVGGSFRLASEFAAYLANQQYSVSYLCCAPGRASDYPEYEVVDGVHLFRYQPASKPLSGLGRLRFHLAAAGRLAKRIHHERPIDVISGHSPLQSLGAARAIRTAFCNYTVHSPFDDELMSKVANRRPDLQTRIAGFIAGRVDRRNIQIANRVQTDSQYTLDSLHAKHQRSMHDKGLVAPGWVDTNRYRPRTELSEVRWRLGPEWQTDETIFFTLRRLENRMGLDTLIDACRTLKSEKIPFRTLIGGGGSLKESLQHRIDQAGLQSCVRLLGRLPEKMLADAYAVADCFVLPTRSLECFGLIVLEAFACNTPVIASAAAAIPELAGKQGNEWLFEPGNVDQLANRMRRFLRQDLQSRLNLREIALQYDKPETLRQWERLLREHS